MIILPKADEIELHAWPTGLRRIGCCSPCRWRDAGPCSWPPPWRRGFSCGPGCQPPWSRAAGGRCPRADGGRRG